MLLRARNEARGLERVRIVVLGSREHNFFTNGAVELFDCAAQGRVDAFFLGGGQIDGQANINLVGTGDYPTSDVRWPGSFGSAFLYYVVPRVILFREEHSPRVFVDKVDFISAPGTSEGIVRNGGPYALLTGLALFDFDRSASASLSKRASRRNQRRCEADTGFGYDEPAMSDDPEPDADTLAVARTRNEGTCGDLSAVCRHAVGGARGITAHWCRLVPIRASQFRGRWRPGPIQGLSAGAIGIPSRVRVARVAWLCSPEQKSGPPPASGGCCENRVPGHRLQP